jgi:hypothetical protein
MRERTGAAFIRSASCSNDASLDGTLPRMKFWLVRVVAINRAQLGIVLIAGATWRCLATNLDWYQIRYSATRWADVLLSLQQGSGISKAANVAIWPLPAQAQ